MHHYLKRNAQDLKLIPAVFSDHKDKGTVVFIDRESIAAGAQCSKCHTVIWFDFTNNPVMNQRPPASIPEFGDEVKKYLQEQWGVVLSVLPDCPECGGTHFDHPVTDYSFQRWPTGEAFEVDEINTTQKNLDASEIDVWWLDDKATSEIFGRAWINHIEKSEEKISD